MEIEYISDDEPRGVATKDCLGSNGAFYCCDSIFYDQYVKVESTVDDNLHQIINYPQLEKHTTNKIVSMINAIDAINKKLKMQVKAKKHRFKTRSRKIYGQSYPWVYV